MIKLSKSLGLLAICLLIGCNGSDAERQVDQPADLSGEGGKSDSFKAAELELLYEADFDDLLQHPDTSRFEASGTAVLDDRVYIVFDNLRQFVSLDISLDDPVWLGDPGGYGLLEDAEVDDPDEFEGYEGIAANPATGVLALAIESMHTVGGEIVPAVAFWNDGPAGYRLLDQRLAEANDGAEGVSWLRHGGAEYLVALCETGGCADGAVGRLLLYEREGESLTAAGTLDLPAEVEFGDFSGLTIRDDRVLVVSQKSSALWVGAIETNPSRELQLVTEGLWSFPRQDDGDVEYCNVEGVDFLNDDVIVVVSDKEKKSQPDRCAKKAESIHFFALPGR